jgi:phenylacetate-CoA ligase
MFGKARFLLATAINGETEFPEKLRETRWLENATLSDYNKHVERKLQASLLAAKGNCSWYAERIPSSMNASPIELLSACPVLTKADLQASASQIRSSSYRGRIQAKTTGGSTGQPVTVYKDPQAVGLERAATWAAYSSYGIELGERCIRFWGTPTSRERSLRSALADLATNRITLSAFALDTRTLERHWIRCVKARAPFYYGYASMLTAFANFVAAQGYDGRAVGARVIVSTSEVLARPDRQKIEQVFGAAVRDEYGCGELGPIAYECEKGLLHVTSNNVYVEIVTANGSPAQCGESGKLIVTDLNNRAMPLVRFEVGDHAERGPECSCGRRSPTIARIWGREYDFVEDAEGRRYHGEYLVYLFEDLAKKGCKIRQFQVLQNPDRSIEVRIVPGEHAELLLALIQSEVEARLPGLIVRCRVVSEVQRKPSGKTPVIIRRD